MRIRQWAVLGAAFAMVWAGGAGIASAHTTAGQEQECLPGVPSEGDGGLPFPECDGEGLPEFYASASVGCDGVGALDVEVHGAEPGEQYTLVPDSSRTVRSEPSTADDHGVVDLFVDFTPRPSGLVDFEVQRPDENPIVAGEVEIVDTCRGAAQLVVTRDCLTPETVQFALTVTGLVPNQTYGVYYGGDGVVDPTTGEPTFVPWWFTTDASGAATVATTGKEDGDHTFADRGFTVEYSIYQDEVDLTTSIVGTAAVQGCAAAGGTTTAPTTTPTTTAPGTTAQSVAPVVVVPAATAKPPASTVLANTGAPAAALALVGGGLLVAGAGALMATRRRA